MLRPPRFGLATGTWVVTAGLVATGWLFALSLPVRADVSPLVGTAHLSIHGRPSMAEFGVLSQPSSARHQTGKGQPRVHDSSRALGRVKGSMRGVRSQLGWLNQNIAAQAQVIRQNHLQQEKLRHSILVDQITLHRTRVRYRDNNLALVKTKHRLRLHLAVFNNELQFIEQHGNVPYLSVLVKVHNFSQFVSRLFLLVEVGQILGRQVRIVQGMEHRQKLLRGKLSHSLHHIQRLSVGLRRQVAVLRVANRHDLAHQAELTNLRSQALQALHHSLTESMHWQTLRKSRPHLLTTLSTRLHAINQTLANLIRAAGSGAMGRHQLYQSLYPLVAPIAKTFALPTSLVMAIITEESGGQQTAISRTGAIGLMQLEPGTARWLGIDPYNPRANVIGGCLYLHQLLHLFHGRLSLALSAYNAGPQGVVRTQSVLPATRIYVSQVRSLFQTYQTMVYAPAPVPIATKKQPTRTHSSPAPVPALSLKAWGFIRPQGPLAP